MDLMKIMKEVIINCKIHKVILECRENEFFLIYLCSYGRGGQFSIPGNPLKTVRTV